MDEDRPTGIWPQFSPKVDLGHLIQAVVLVLTVGGAYVTIRADQARTDAQLVALVSAEAASQAALNLRISTDEHRMDVSDQGIREWETSQSDALQRVDEAVHDLKGAIDAMKRR